MVLINYGNPFTVLGALQNSPPALKEKELVKWYMVLSAILIGALFQFNGIFQL